MTNQPLIGKSENLSGRVFGRLTVKEFFDKTKHGHPRWLCACECGKEKVALAQLLKSGMTKSCGCLNSELSARRKTTHGMYYTNERSIWQKMLERTRNQNNRAYPKYKTFGPPDAWLSFENFIADMGPRPSAGHSLDRIDNTQGYSKENCRWATRIQQARNMSTNVHVEINGVTKLLCEWLEEVQVSRSTYNSRRKRGWSVVDAITKPLDASRRKK